MKGATDNLISIEAFQDILRRSGLISGTDISPPPQATPQSWAQELVSCQLLTPYQADKLLAGLWQGLVLGPYRILQPIGRGGMGLVYLAKKDNQIVALKILPPRRSQAEPRTLARFKREMRFGRLIPPHPNVVKVLDSGSIDGVHYLAMDYVPGPTLRRRITKHGVLSAAQAALVGMTTANALNAVHAVGVIHRDVKPSNIILTPDGSVKLLDFGFAYNPDEPLPEDPTIAGGSGYTLGTLDYIAPEQVNNAATVTPTADIYGLGCTLYFVLTGTPPYPGGDPYQKMKWHRRAEAPPVATINPEVPEKLSAYIAQMMAKDPALRPQSAREVEAALRPWSTQADAIVVAGIDTLPTDALPEEAEPIKGNPSPIVTWIVAAMVFVGVVLTVMVLVLKFGPR